MDKRIKCKKKMALQGRAYRRNISYNLGVWHKTQNHKRKHRLIQVHKVKNFTLKASINNIRRTY